MKHSLSVLFFLFLAVFTFSFTCFAAEGVYQGSLLDDELAELAFDVIPVETVGRTATLSFNLPVIGKVALHATEKDGETSQVEGIFPLPEKPFALGPLEITSGTFSLLPDGALAYSGNGSVMGQPVQLGLRRLLFLTADEKKILDDEQKKNVERKEEKTQLEYALDTRSQVFFSEDDHRLDSSLSLDKAKTKDSFWSFVAQPTIKKQGVAERKIAKSVTTLGDMVAVKEAIFSLVAPGSFFSIPVGRTRFEVRQAELVLGYGHAPVLRFFIDFMGTRIETTVTFSIKDKDFSLSMMIQKLTGAGIFTLLGIALPDNPLSQAQFSGAFSLSVQNGALFEGAIFDEAGKPFQLISGEKAGVSLNKLRLALDSKKGFSLQAIGNLFGLESEFFGMLDSKDGLTIAALSSVADITTMIPMLPREQFAGLAFDGRVLWSVKKGLQFRGNLSRKEAPLINFWGLMLDDVALQFDSSSLSTEVSGNFSLFDLHAHALLDISLGTEQSVLCSAELKQDASVEWAPASLADYLKGQKKALEPFVLTKLGLVAGLTNQKQPVKALESVMDKSQPKRIPLQKLKKQQLFFAVIGQARIFGQPCRAAVAVQKDSKLGFLLLAEPIKEFSLRYVFPEVFEIAEGDSIIARYFKNVIGGTALSDASFVLSTVQDVAAGINPGLNIRGAVAYVGDPKENPVFAPFFNAAQLPLYFKKDGKRGIGISVAGVLDPINFKNSVVQLGFGTGDIGLFAKLGEVKEVGIKNTMISVELYPFKAEATLGGGCLYTAEGGEQAMQFDLKGTADLIGFGGEISGVGDFDFAAYLPLILGRSVRDVLSQRIIFRDGGFVFKTTWAAVESIVGAIGTAIETFGVGAVMGVISAIVTAVDTLGFAGGVEIGQLNDPLSGDVKIRAGVDISDWLFQLMGEKPGGFTSLVCFLFDLLLYITTFGHKDFVVPDMRVIQDAIAKIVPLDLERFYLKFVPIGTRIGGVRVPAGIGGDATIRLFNNTKAHGALMLDSSGFYATAYLDPITLWKIFELRPSEAIGKAAQKIEEDFAMWNLSTDDKKGKVAIEAIAHLEKGLQLGTDFDLRIGDTIGGSLRAKLGLTGLDLQGDFTIKIPELAQYFGVPEGALSCWVKGTQVDLDNPLKLLYQLDPKNIGLEVGFTNSLTEALQSFVADTLQGVENQLSSLINNVLIAAISRTEKRALFVAEEKEEKICAAAEADKSFVAKCAEARATHAALKAKDFVLDRLDDIGLQALPEAARGLLLALNNSSAGVLKAGRYSLTAVGELFRIENVFWRGTLQDLSTGVIPGFTVVVMILGHRIELHGVGRFDLTKNPLEWIRTLGLDVARLIISRILKPIADEDAIEKTLLQVQRALPI